MAMDEESFRQFLKRGGRKPHVVDRVVSTVRRYEAYLSKFADGKNADQATPQDIDAYAEWLEEEGQSAKGELWAIRYYYRFTENKFMATRVAQLREARTKKTRRAFRLGEFRGVNPDYIQQLESIGILDIDQMRERGKTPARRAELAIETEIPEEAILELVKLSDLARLPGVKGIRARLYYDVGIDTMEKMAAQDPQTLLTTTRRFVESTGFDGIAPLPKEAESTIKTAKELPKEIEY